MPKKEKIVLIDANALIHRAFHALPALRTKAGELINATYGFTSTLLKVMREVKPTYIAATFDSKEKTFRHEEFAEYKAHRPPYPSEIYEQIPRIKEILTSFSIPLFEKEGFEADDLIGVLAEKAKKEGCEVIIVTGDLDTLQLIGPKIKVYTLRRGITETIIFDEKKVKERYGLRPDQLIDYKSLRGDPSDNIPGVLGIGEKTAQKLISDFSSLENLYQEIEKKTEKAQKLPPRLKENLINYKKQAFLSKKLVTIKKDIPLKFNLEASRFSTYSQDKVRKLFSELGFRTLLDRLPSSKKEKNPPLEKSKNDLNYKIINKEKDLEELIGKLETSSAFSLDLEATSQDPMKAELIGLSFSFKEKEAYYLPVKEKEDKDYLGRENVLRRLKPILENPRLKKYGHNIKYDMVLLLNYGIPLLGVDFDTMIGSYLLHPTTRAHDLDSVAFSELGVQTIPLSSLIGSGKKQIPTNEVPLSKLAFYSCEDADITLRLVSRLKEKLEKEKLDSLFYEIEMPLVSVLAKMEYQGVKIDSNFLSKLSSALSKKILACEKKIYDDVGYHFNINSPQQLSTVLFEVLGLPKEEVRRTKTGISTAASELEKLKGTHPVIDGILTYRELAKIKTTYVDALPNLINPKTDRLHTSFNQTVTATGRLSSSDPNLQNIPLRGEYGEALRRSFIAPLGFKLLAADYSQIELRIIASLSSDERMIEAFLADEDIHRSTASEIFNIPIEKISNEERRSAKTINFGIIYGMSSHGLSQALGIDHEQARTYIEKYFNLHQGLKSYIEETIEKTRETGYAETIFGRRRPIPEINSSLFNLRGAAERMAINMPIQGTCADLIKMAMVKISDKLGETNEKPKMILQVHDELVFEVPEKEIKRVASLVKDIMENIHQFKVPIKVDISVGPNWGEMKKLKV